MAKKTAAEKEADKAAAKARSTTWDDAAKAANRPAPVQTRLDVGDAVTEFQEIEMRIPISDDEVAMLDRRSAENLADADEEQKRLDDYSKPIKVKIKKLREDASKDAADSKARSRLQVQRVRVVYSPNTATVRFYDPDSGREVQLSRAMTSAEMSRIGEGPLPPPDGERLTVDEETGGDA